ncbi:MAG: SMI1/KNR4 family protein [Ruminococcus sp.]|nr:SMI1/KNR4 family protein [Ruminococcus sp.]
MNIMKEDFEHIQKMCHLLDEDRKSSFEPPATEKEISDWEKQNGITIPEQYREWLLLTKHAYIYGGYFELFFPEVYNNCDYVFIGDIIGDGECLYFSKTDGAMYRDFEGEITEYKDFDDFLAYLEIMLEDFAEDIHGENWTELYDNMNDNSNIME